MAPETATAPEICSVCNGLGIIIGDDGSTKRCACRALESSENNERFLRAQIPQRFVNKSLDTFKAGKGDQVRQRLLQHAKAYSEMFSRQTDKGILLRGGTGSGKTHIAIGVLQKVIRRGFTGIYYNCTDLLARLRGTFNNGSDQTEAAILDEVDSVDLLVLDDLGAESPSEWVRDRLYLIINRRYESARPTIITTNCDDLELAERLGQRIVSRLYEMCERFEKFPDEDFRAANMR